MKRGDELAVRVRSLAFGGDAVGELPDGRVVFFDGGVPGDEALVRIDELKPRFARGSLVRVLAPGEARVAAPCALASRCGGCQWQAVRVDAQRAAKQAIVERALGRLGAEVRPIVAATEPSAYRSRVRVTVGRAQGHAGAGPGAAPIGFHARRTNDVVDVESCPLLEPALDRALARARDALSPHLREGGSISALVGRGGAVHVAVEGMGEGAARAAFALVDGATIVGAVVDGRRHGQGGVDTSVDTSIEGAIGRGPDEPGELPFMAAADGFAQASHAGNHALRRVVREAVGGPHASALELFAGDGNFTRDLVRVAERVLAVEGVGAACERLRANVVAAEGRLAVVAEPAERATARLASEGARFDLVLLDPPRAGAPLVVDPLAALSDRVVYVSCDPMTLARDAAALASRGLRPIRATPVDMAPHTFHVETVCLFVRS